MTNKKYSILFFTFIFSLSLSIAPAYSQEENIMEVPDSSSVEQDEDENFGNEESSKTDIYKRNFPVGISSVILPNIVIGSWNRFVIKSGWAQVSWDEISHFYNREQAWDRDWYWTNFVLHPYQGSLTYMGARAANFNQFESTLFGTASSFIWEYLFETNAPSKNDLIYTSLGCFPVGEMLYRLSYSMQDTWSPLRFLASPTRLYTDPIMGKKSRPYSGTIEELSLAVGIGSAIGETFPEKDYSSLREFYPGNLGFDVKVVYNDPYTHDSNDPFSQFELYAGGKIGTGCGEGYKPAEEKMFHDIFIFSNGMLFARNPNWGENSETSIGLVLDYDFVWNSFFEFTSLAPGFSIKQNIEFEDSSFAWQLHLDVLILGTTEFFYTRRQQVSVEGSTRSYSYTTGAEMVNSIKWTIHDKHFLDLTLHSFFMYAFEGQLEEGLSTGYELLSFAALSYEYAVSPKVNLGLKSDFYGKISFYDDLPRTTAFFCSPSVYTRIKF